MKLTKNFNSEEFACKDGNEVPEKLIPNVQKLANNLQALRDNVGKPIVVNSGYRTAKHNKSVGGASSSQHLTASAGDIRIAGMTSKQVYDAILNLIKEGKMHNGGVGLYNTFVHYDIRQSPSRWDLRT
ncbi:Peptidase M15 [Soonwooa buanensis]|uniref:Peptidase M15 n=1 Tax=Soonwooa buanensis TaxID=619805 RepID=A0A1T5CVZ3_9FLAO|nr:D-Ala-D-Ala carboxypeptidase family metallohydrolase [Soonwooa buanensis]SKB63685.1 Peptidase M15 [Soonwooa buanensis]